MPAPSVKKGQKINFVIRGGDHTEHAEARATADGPDAYGQLDLVVDAKHPKHAGLTVTKSPHDPDGKKPDSWHVPASSQPAQAAPATTK